MISRLVGRLNAQPWERIMPTHVPCCVSNRVARQEDRFASSRWQGIDQKVALRESSDFITLNWGRQKSSAPAVLITNAPEQTAKAYYSADVCSQRGMRIAVRSRWQAAVSLLLNLAPSQGAPPLVRASWLAISGLWHPTLLVGGGTNTQPPPTGS